MSASIDGGTLIKIKDVIHTKWFDLQQTKRSNPEFAFVQKKLLDEIIELGYQALSDLKQLNPGSIYIERIEKPLFAAQHKSYVADETWIGPRIWYVMTPERGQAVITQDINKLANQIHLAGMSEIKFTGQYCGCKFAEGLEDLRAINSGVLRYCEGTLKLGYLRGTVHDPGDAVEHRPGGAETHANTIAFEPTEYGGYDIKMEYVESGDCAWSMRQDGVVARIRALNGTCETEDLFARCEIKDASEEDIFQIALLISQMKDIDLQPEACIDLAFDGVDAQSRRLTKIEPRKDVWNSPWTKPGDMPDVSDCRSREEYGSEYDADESRSDRWAERREAERREERRTLRRQRLEADTLHQEQHVKDKIEESGEQGCVFRAYDLLDDANIGLADLEDYCEKLSDIDHSRWSWCMGLHKDAAEGLAEAAKDLVERCRPEPIILGLEAASRYGRTDSIKRVCQIAEDDACIEAVRQMRKRWEEGTYPGVLPLEQKPKSQDSTQLLKRCQNLSHEIPVRHGDIAVARSGLEKATHPVQIDAWCDVFRGHLDWAGQTKAEINRALLQLGTPDQGGMDFAAYSACKDTLDALPTLAEVAELYLEQLCPTFPPRASVAD